jgi:glyoxylase-like metal-dependent hydrolase (beta-lactamase superfamily II)
VLVHWVRHSRLGDFLIDTGFDDSFAKHPPYGNYSGQEPGEDLQTQLARRRVHPKAVFFTHLHPDHTAGVPALGPGTQFVFGSAEPSFWPSRRRDFLWGTLWISLATDPFGRSRHPGTQAMTSRISLMAPHKLY